MNLDTHFLEGVRLFNAGDFFDAHERWEDLWVKSQNPEKKFLQGLIQMATCFHHARKGNFKGARQLFETGRVYLAGSPEGDLVIHLENLLKAWDALMEPVMKIPFDDLPGRLSAGRPTTVVAFEGGRFPVIQLREGPSSS